MGVYEKNPNFVSSKKKYDKIPTNSNLVGAEIFIENAVLSVI